MGLNRALNTGLDKKNKKKKKKFNTGLAGKALESFNTHAQMFPNLIGDQLDYDTQGFYQEVYKENKGDFDEITRALTPGSPTAHVGTDRYKKPNHPTFSNESKYSRPFRRGGEWGHDEQGDFFNARRRNIKNMEESDGSPYQYFQRAEDYDQDGVPDVHLNYRGKQMFQDGVSELGYSDGSPYRNAPYLDMDTPSGRIDMSNTGIDIMANNRLLPAYSGMHQFDTDVVRERPAYQDGTEDGDEQSSLYKNGTQGVMENKYYPGTKRIGGKGKNPYHKRKPIKAGTLINKGPAKKRPKYTPEPKEPRIVEDEIPPTPLNPTPWGGGENYGPGWNDYYQFKTRGFLEKQFPGSVDYDPKSGYQNTTNLNEDISDRDLNKALRRYKRDINPISNRKLDNPENYYDREGVTNEEDNEWWGSGYGGMMSRGDRRDMLSAVRENVNDLRTKRDQTDQSISEGGDRSVDLQTNTAFDPVFDNQPYYVDDYGNTATSHDVFRPSQIWDNPQYSMYDELGDSPNLSTLTEEQDEWDYLNGEEVAHRHKSVYEHGAGHIEAEDTDPELDKIRAKEELYTSTYTYNQGIKDLTERFNRGEIDQSQMDRMFDDLWDRTGYGSLSQSTMRLLDRDQEIYDEVNFRDINVPGFGGQYSYTKTDRPTLRRDKSINIPEPEIKDQEYNEEEVLKREPVMYQNKLGAGSKARGTWGKKALPGQLPEGVRRYGSAKQAQQKLEYVPEEEIPGEVEIPTYQSGSQDISVSDLYQQQTGKPWGTAKEEGLTSGSTIDNMKLKQKLLGGLGQLTADPISGKSMLSPDAALQAKINSAKSMEEAFAMARESLGPNKIFEWNKRKFGTNLAGETFSPSGKAVKKAGLDNDKTKKRIAEQNKMVKSPYTSKEVVKLEPEYKDWDEIKKRKQEINKMTQADKIVASNAAQSGEKQYKVNQGDNISTIAKKYGTSTEQIMEDNNLSNTVIHPGQKLKVRTPGKNAKQYVIVDKKTGRMHLYRGGNKMKTYEVLTGKKESDAQTVTKQKYYDPKGKEVTFKDAMRKVVGKDGVTRYAPKDGYNIKTDWDAGNLSTGAGVYTISGINPESKYRHTPLFNMTNDAGLEVSTSIHAAPRFRDKFFEDAPTESNRKSYGCLNMKCGDVSEIYDKWNLKQGDKVYILPDEENNEFVYENNKINLRQSKGGNKHQKYIDEYGIERKGQGVNKSVNTLNYVPIKAFVNRKTLQAQANASKGGWSGGWNKEQYGKVVLPFAYSLQKNKKEIMKAAKINGDIYNEIAKMAFGILGTETNFGDEHNAAANLMRAGAKWWDPKGSSSPDYKSKQSTYDVSGEGNSVGLTQIRWSYLDNAEKTALKKMGITSNKDFMEPDKAAIATATILAVRYNQQLHTAEEKKNMWKTLPAKWNNRSNYPDRVKQNSKHFILKQLD
jgi:LysM repeat protein